MIVKSNWQYVLHKTCVDPEKQFVGVKFKITEVNRLRQLLTDSALRLYVLSSCVSLGIVEEKRVA